jgi:cholesterol transport system auxiliary component
MITRRLRALLAAAAALCGVGGCALLFKSAPATPRYFSPERPSDLPRSASRRPDPPYELRLGRVDSAANIEDTLVLRDSANEVGYYRLRRWTEAPEQYLRRRLARVLFEERGVREVVSGAGPTLDVQLTAFEEVRGPPRTARVQVIVRLHDARLVSWDETITMEQPVAAAGVGNGADADVEAIGAALRAAVDQIADRVIDELAASAATRPHP